MSNKSPLVSIGLPVYNGENYLRDAIESLLEQTFTDFEIIISDNASTDRTKDIVSEFASVDSRIVYLRSDVNRGAAWNYNRVFELSRGKYFKWAAHDDRLHCEFLSKSVAILEEDNDVVLCSSRTGQIDEHGEVLEHSYVTTRNLLEPNSGIAERFGTLVCPRRGQRVGWTRIFGLIRSEVLRETPLIASYIGSDLVLLGELGLRGKVVDLDDVLFWRREHEQTSTRGAYQPRRKRLIWFDPDQNYITTLPEWRLNIELLRAIFRQRLGWLTKIRSTGYIFLRFWKRRRQVVEDLYFAIRDLGEHLYSLLSPTLKIRLLPLLRLLVHIETRIHSLLKSSSARLTKPQ